MRQVNKLSLAVTTVAVAGLIVAPVAHAALTADSTLTQAITAGTLSTSIRDAAGAVVATPSFAMSATTVSTAQQTTTGQFGATDRRITVDNPGAATGATGWTLTLNATTPGTGVWNDGASHTYAYNGTAAAGQLTVNPSVATLTPVTGTATGITKGTSTAFSGSTAITLLTAASSSDDIWNGYITGVGLSQTIPANTPAGSYSIGMTQTVAAV